MGICLFMWASFRNWMVFKHWDTLSFFLMHQITLLICCLCFYCLFLSFCRLFSLLFYFIFLLGLSSAGKLNMAWQSAYSLMPIIMGSTLSEQLPQCCCRNGYILVFLCFRGIEHVFFQPGFLKCCTNQHRHRHCHYHHHQHRHCQHHQHHHVSLLFGAGLKATAVQATWQSGPSACISPRHRNAKPSKCPRNSAVCLSCKWSPFSR